MKAFVRALQIAPVLALICMQCQAATISGIIKDSSGAVVPSVAVQAKNVSTGATATATTDANGAYTITVSAGTYEIRIEKPGFQLFTKQVTVAEDGALKSDIQLAIAEVKEEVEVTGKISRFANSDPVYRQIRDTDVTESFQVDKLVISRDAGKLTLTGIVTFTAPISGRHTMAVFSGDGHFELKPRLAAEIDELKRQMSMESIDEDFKRLAIAFTDRTYDQVKDAGKPVAVDPKAKDILHDYRHRVRHRTETPRSFVEWMLNDEYLDNVDADTLADILNPKRPGFFRAFIFGDKYSDLRFIANPYGAFPQLPSPEEIAVVNLDTNQTNDGIWYLGHIMGEYERHTASSHENKRTVEAKHYTIETVIGKNTHLDSTAKFRFRAVRDGDRVIKFGMLPNLRVSAVTKDGKEIPYIQESRKADGSFYVIMPEPMARDQEYELSIEYSGDKVIRGEGGGNFAVGARTSWYPSVNAFIDRATFDLTFKVPKNFTVISVGKLVKEGREDNYTVSQWKSDIPLAVAGFNYGAFKKKSVDDDSTKYTIEGYAGGELPDYLRNIPGFSETSPSRLSEQAIVQAENSMRLFTAYFGAAPYGRIAITQQPQFFFGQSWPTLVYLPVSAFLDSTQRWQLMGIQRRFSEFIDEVTPHEVSHQWWGHMVGWASFHDQWLSEGFADFSAGLYLQMVEKAADKYLKYWEHARDAILDKNNFGKSGNDAGPIWMGLRLSSFHNPGGYQSVVYNKGGYVLHMLRQIMYDQQRGDEDFIATMQDFVKSNMNKNASTEDFIDAVNRHMKPSLDLDGNGRMDWFFREWVYGTSVPRYEFNYDVSDAGGGVYQLNATVTQFDVPADFKMAVPIYVDFDGKLMRLGLAKVQGSGQPFKISAKLPKKPKRVLINAYHDVLEPK